MNKPLIWFQWAQVAEQAEQEARTYRQDQAQRKAAARRR